MNELIFKKMTVADERMNLIISEPQSINKSTMIQSRDIQLTKDEGIALTAMCPTSQAGC